MERVASRRPFSYQPYRVVEMNPAWLRADSDRAVIPAPFGALALESSNELLLNIELKTSAVDFLVPSTPLLREAVWQFNAYFEESRWRFSLPLPSEGTPYQQLVWSALCAIPPGAVKSYGLIATELHSGARSVAGACRANRFPLAIPCHRAVAGTGLGGYCGQISGPMLDIKRWLLRHEGYEFP